LALSKSPQSEMVVALLDGSRLEQPTLRKQKTVTSSLQYVFMELSFAKNEAPLQGLVSRQGRILTVGLAV
jgi:hypothetical protein